VIERIAVFLGLFTVFLRCFCGVFVVFGGGFEGDDEHELEPPAGGSSAGGGEVRAEAGEAMVTLPFCGVHPS